jgi:hypothetical protein
MSIFRRLPPPNPTPKQLEELDHDLQPLRDAYPGRSDTELLGTVPGRHIRFERQRRHKLLPDDQPLIP